MLREIVQAFEALARDRTLILWLEDLHWSDYSTLDLMSALARRTEPARLLMIGTYRPVDVLLRKHPLLDIKAELEPHGNCHDLALQCLSQAAVQEYLEARVGTPTHAVAPGTARFIHRSTEGNPLFMATVVDDSLRRGVLHRADARWELAGDIENATSSIPSSLRQLIERPLDRLDDFDRHLLEVASVAGASFAVAAVAAGLDAPLEPTDERCVELVRRGDLLQRDATAEAAGARYRFVHAFHRQAAYERLSESRRRLLHARIGEWEERSRGDQAGSIAGELAMHFEQAHDTRRALAYLQRAAENALRRSAHREATTLAHKGLELLEGLPEGAERTETELALGAALVALKGYATPEVGQVYARERELHEQIGETPRLLLMLAGLQTYYMQRAELHTAKAIALQCLAHARDSASLLLTHSSLGSSLSALADFLGARQHFEQALALYDDRYRDAFLFYGRDPGVISRSLLAATLCHLGYFEQAWSGIDAAVHAARAASQPFTMAVALVFAASLETFGENGDHGMRLAQEALAIASEQRYPYSSSIGSRGYFWPKARMTQALRKRRRLSGMRLPSRASSRPADWSCVLPPVSRSCTRRGEAPRRSHRLARPWPGLQKGCNFPTCAPPARCWRLSSMHPLGFPRR